MAGVENMNLRMSSYGIVDTSMDEIEVHFEAVTKNAPVLTRGWTLAVAPPANPFRHPSPIASRTSGLTTKEFRKLYEAAAFALWRYESPMNAHLVIAWELMGIEPHRGAKLLCQYLHRAQKWARQGGRSRISWEMHYLYVHENAPGRGFHSHVLINLEGVHRKAFEKWSRESLAALIKRHVRVDAFRLIHRRPKTRDAAVQRAWGWFRYVTKQYDGQREYCLRDDSGQYSWVPLRQVFRLFRARTALPISPMKLCGASHSIGKTAQAQAGFQSKFWSDETTQPYNEDFGGWELQQLAKTLEQGMQQPRVSLR